MCMSYSLSSFSQAYRKYSATAAEFISRRSRLVDRIRHAVHSSLNEKTVVVIVRSAGRQFYAPDVPHPFRQNSYFRYLTGSLQQEAVLKIISKPGADCNSVMYIKELTEKEELWDGPGEKVEEIVRKSGLNDVRNRDEFANGLENDVRTCLMSFDVGQFSSKEDEVTNILAGSRYVEALREHIDELRWIKSSLEREKMRETCRIGAQSMNAMIHESCNVTNENVIVGRLELEARRRGADFLAYPPVVAAGERANIIHYLDANNPIEPGDMVLVDAGCELDGYVSDITRVFPINGHYSNAQLSLVDALNDTHSHLIEMSRTVRPLKLNELYMNMLKILSKNLLEVGVFAEQFSFSDLLHITDQLCPHHVSHYLGMDVHDTASIPRNIPLKPGVVFTIEPGIYIRNGTDFLRPEFHGIGLRVEDDILVTENGIEVLTDGASRSSLEIERLMKN